MVRTTEAGLLLPGIPENIWPRCILFRHGLPPPPDRIVAICAKMLREEGPLPPKTALSGVRPVFRAVTATVVPEAAALDDSEWRELEALVDEALDKRPPALRRQLRTLLRVVQWWPILRHGKPFTALTPQARTRFLCHLQEHRVERIRVGFWGVRTLALLGYYGREQARAAIGYRPDPRGWGAGA